MFFRKLSLFILHLGLVSLATMPICFGYVKYESIDNIKAVVENFIKSNVVLNSDETMEIEFNQVQLRLAACTSEIIASFPRESTREHFSSIEITCNNEKKWQAYVPVLVHVYTNVLTARQVLSPKQIIREDDLEYVQSDKNRLFNGYFKNKEEVIGLEASQFINPGTVLTKRNIQPPTLVHRRDTIDIIAKRNQMSVTVKGIAQSDGRLGESIKALNPSSNREIDAVVVGSGKVEVL